MNRTILSIAALAVVVLFPTGAALAHCQVPCGIYDDPARVTQLREDAQTIAKAVDNITKLAGADSGQDANQLVRWTNTKEAHASHIIEVVSEYFLTQKLKPVAAGEEGHDAYLQKLADHHAVMRAAMKTKQTASPDAVKALNAAIDALGKHWE